MIVFENKTEKQHKPHTAVRNIRMEVDPNSDIHGIIEAFGDFLKASGFSADAVDTYLGDDV